MWAGAGLERDAAGIALARRVVREIEPGDRETANLALIADRLLASAALRTESRGAHFRSDHPSSDPAQVRRIAWAGDEPVLLATAGAHTTRRAA
jgi:L-aspartate oxidase